MESMESMESMEKTSSWEETRKKLSLIVGSRQTKLSRLKREEDFFKQEPDHLNRNEPRNEWRSQIKLEEFGQKIIRAQYLVKESVTDLENFNKYAANNTSWKQELQEELRVAKVNNDNETIEIIKRKIESLDGNFNKEHAVLLTTLAEIYIDRDDWVQYSSTICTMNNIGIPIPKDTEDQLNILLDKFIEDKNWNEYFYTLDTMYKISIALPKGTEDQIATLLQENMEIKQGHEYMGILDTIHKFNMPIPKSAEDQLNILLDKYIEEKNWRFYWRALVMMHRLNIPTPKNTHTQLTEIMEDPEVKQESLYRDILSTAQELNMPIPKGAEYQLNILLNTHRGDEWWNGYANILYTIHKLNMPIPKGAEDQLNILLDKFIEDKNWNEYFYTLDTMYKISIALPKGTEDQLTTIMELGEINGKNNRFHYHDYYDYRSALNYMHDLEFRPRQ